MEIREVTAALARSMRTDLPAHHIDDDQPLALHLGAFEGDALRGVISGLPAGPEGQTDGSWRLVIGPYGDHHAALLDALAARSREVTALWSPDEKPGFSSHLGRYERHILYSAASIEVLEGVDAIRKRPGMYVGNLGPRGVSNLLFELVSNSLDEHLAGHAMNVSITVRTGEILVEDDGRGIPVDCDPTLLEKICTELHGSSFRATPPRAARKHRHVGDFGLGLVVVCALSEEMVITIDRGHRYQQRFQRGRPVAPLADLGPTSRRGTHISFRPDPTIFEQTYPDLLFTSTLADLAVLNPSIHLTLDGTPIPSHGGLLGYARTLAAPPITRAHEARGCIDGISIEVALCFGSGEGLTRGWANQMPATGSHIRALRRALRDTPTSGLVALVAVELDDAIYAGRTKERLEMPLVEHVVGEFLVGHKRAWDQVSR